jgi:hypothetical protein
VLVMTASNSRTTGDLANVHIMFRKIYIWLIWCWFATCYIFCCW